MIEDISAIQSRIAEIQQRIASLSPAASPAVAPGAPSFGQTLQQAVAMPATLPGIGTSAAPSGASEGITTIDGQPIRVPPAALGPLPPMPILPQSVVPMTHANSLDQYESLIQTYAAKHNVPAPLIKAVIQTESGGNPRAVSRAGAMGLMQLMPANVHEAGIHDPFDPEQNIAAGTQQLAGLLAQYHGDLDLTLAGYNAGPGNVRKYSGVPPFAETQNYIRKVRAAMEKG